METKHVVAAVIEHNGKIFAARRGYGEFKDGWEFPGGKVEPKETPQQALIREIQEELDTVIQPGELIDTIESDYPSFHLSMDCFFCTVTSGKLTLLEHEDARWLDIDHLYDVDWLPGDLSLIPLVQLHMRDLHPGDTVSHFKRELPHKDPDMYLYRIVGDAVDSETRKHVMVYQALYGTKKMYVRPLDMFLSEVDHKKYPEIKTKYRFTRK